MSEKFETRNKFVNQVQTYDRNNSTDELRFVLKKEGKKGSKKIDFPLCDVITNAHESLLSEYLEKGWKITKYKVKK